MNATSRNNMPPIRALLLEDNDADAALILRRLAAAGLQVRGDQVRTSTEFLERLATSAYDLILCDFSLPGWNGLEALRWVRRSGGEIPFIYVSGTLGEEVAVECIKEGATDYVLKNNLTRLPHAIQRALSEQELRRQKVLSEEQYRLLFDRNPVPMWVYDRKTLTFLAVNEEAVRKYGYSKEEFLQMSILDIRPPEDVAKLRLVLQRHLPGLQSAELWRHRRKDGRLIDVEVTCSDLMFEGKAAVLKMANDVTDILESQENLRQSEERFSKAFRSSPAAMTISTRAEGRYIDVNDSFLRMIGHSRDVVVGQSTLDLDIWVIPEDRDRMIQTLDRVGKIRSLETKFLSKSRGERTVEVSAELIYLDGAACILAITNDITESKLMEEQFRQAQKMEAVGRIAGGVAHDFNNMLSIIMGYCDLAEGKHDKDGLRRDVQQIKKAAQRAAKLTRQLLVFSRRQTVNPTVLNLNNAVQGSLPMLLRVIAADVELTFEPSPSLWNTKADSGQVEQVLINLVINARDAMPQGGRIIIETSNIELDETYLRRHPRLKIGPYVLLTVSDTGGGMDSTTISKIFEPFFTTKAPGKGTGLGLSMVYGAMQQANGHVTVYSQEGKGSTFRLYFPRIEEGAESPPQVEPEVRYTKGWETILLVEDEQDLRELTMELLESEGYKVLDVPDGQAAIAMLKEFTGPVHLLLTDIVLPGITGNELATRILQSRSDIKVIYMSGYTGNLITQQQVLAPGSVLIEKPFTKERLLRQLRVVLDRKLQ